MEIVIPGPATAWARPRVNNGVFFTAKKQRDAKIDLQWLFQKQWGRPPIQKESAVEIYVEFRFKARRKADVSRYKPTKPDADNLVKLLLDAGNRILWHDDAQVSNLHVVKVYGLETETLIRMKEWPQLIK